MSVQNLFYPRHRLFLLECPRGVVIWLARVAFWKVRWLANEGAQVSVDGPLSLWVEGLSEWLSTGNSWDCSDEITVFRAAVCTMVATGVLPPKPRLCPTKTVDLGKSVS